MSRSSLPLRIFWTLARAIALLFASSRVLLPGIPDDLVAQLTRGGSPISFAAGNLGVFALGVMPLVSAYICVELVSLAVPRLSRLRHGNPKGRAKLDRAARILAMVIALVQAWGMAQSLAALGATSSVFGPDLPTISRPLVTASLVGGFCVTLFVAEVISRQAIANGFLFLIALGAIGGFVSDLGRGLAKSSLVGDFHARHGVVLLASVAVAALATWIAVRGVDHVRATVEERSAADPNPYRGARSLAVNPWVPIPSSSFAAYSIATALVALPTTLAMLPGLTGLGRLGQLDLASMSPLVFLLVFLGVLFAVAAVLARILQRPAEMADLAARLGLASAKGGNADVAEGARAARRRALVPTLLYFTAFVLAANAAGSIPHLGVSLMAVPLVVAMAMDAVSGAGGAAYLPVWQERRASAVPVIRAALAAEGIASKARGMHVLSLLQTFAPYAPAEILVPVADAPRASAVLRHLLVGDELVERRPADAGTAADDPNAARAMLTPARRTRGLLVSTGIALALLVLVRVPVRDAASLPVRRANLEVIRVDDTLEPFASTRDADLPAGIELRYENAPIMTSHGSGYQKAHFARVSLRDGETVDAAIARADAWVKGVVLPAGARFAWESEETYDPDTGRATVTGARTFVLVGEPIITTDDVIEAVPAVNEMSGLPEIYVSVTVRPEAGERFGDATREWTNRRIAILLDGRITSAPVVKSEIRGGRMSITMGRGEPDRQMRTAKELARGLAPTH